MGKASSDPGYLTGGRPGPPPHVASASREHGRLCLTPEMVGDKQDLQRPVIICFVLTLDHQSCVCS